MKAMEIRKNKELMNVIEMVARGRSIKTHNCETEYKAPTVEEMKWIKTSFRQCYDRPSRAKQELNDEVIRDVEDAFEVYGDYHYTRNTWMFTISVNVKWDGRLYNLYFTRDNLHVIGYEPKKVCMGKNPLAR